MKPLTLKTKLAAAVSIFFLLLGTCVGFFSLAYFQQQYKKTLFTQLASHASTLAFELDHKISFAQGALQAVVPLINPSAISDPDQAQRLLDSKTTLHLIFDNGLFFLSPEGKLIAESPYRPGRRGRDISYREFFKKTITTGKPYVSSPYISSHGSGRPAILLTVPVFDDHGRMTVILAGSFDLLRGEFLRSVISLRVGQSGYAYLFDRARTMIFHPDTKRITTRVPVGKNRLFDRAIAGFEGSGETITSFGLPVVTSFKQLHSADWVLGITYPLTEAYAPLRTARNYFIAAMALCLMLMLILSWFVTRRLVAPLSRFTRHIEEITANPGVKELVAIKSRDEIGTLAEAYNRLIRTKNLKQAALRESEERYRLLVESSPDAIVVHSGGKYVFANYAALVLYGADCPGQLIGRSILDFVHPDSRAVVEARVRQIYETGAPVPPSEQKLVRLDGASVDIETIGIPFAYEGNPAVQVVIRDITVRMRVEEEIRKLNAELELRVCERTAELEAANRELESFSYSVSHDLRAPLRHIDGYGLALLEDCAAQLSDQGKEYLHRMRAASQRMGLLIDGMLQLASVSRREIQKQIVGLSSLAQTVALELKQAHPERAVTFGISENVKANGDPLLLRAVMENLIGNAWKYTGNREEAFIEFGATEKGGKLAYFVRDNGVGFDMQHADKLFSPFQRLHRADEFEGTGIGLATVQRIVHRHGGEVWAEGEVGKGAVVYFTLPGA